MAAASLRFRSVYEEDLDKLLNTSPGNVDANSAGKLLNAVDTAIDNRKNLKSKNQKSLYINCVCR